MFDLIIIGAGPGGLTAAIYARRSNLSVAIIEKSAPGGAIINTKNIENYPGYENIDGVSLALNMFSQVQKLKTTFINDNITKLEKENNIFKVIGKKVYEAKYVIIASGTTYNTLSLPNEEKYLGRGLSFCALCDGGLYKEKEVAVVGGGSSALEEALYLADVTKKVYLIHRRDTFRGEDTLVQKAKNHRNIVLKLSSEVIEYIGEKQIEAVKIKDANNNVSILKVGAVFLYVGSHVDDSYFKDLKITNNNGYIETNEKMETSIEGLFAIGDCRAKEIRQIVTATSDGAIAASNIVKRLK